MFRRTLACSFCGRNQADVAKLVAGPRVYICDRCAAEVSRIIEQSNNKSTSEMPEPTGVLRRAYERIVRRWPFRRDAAARTAGTRSPRALRAPAIC